MKEARMQARKEQSNQGQMEVQERNDGEKKVRKKGGKVTKTKYAMLHVKKKRIEKEKREEGQDREYKYTKAKGQLSE